MVTSKTVTITIATPFLDIWVSPTSGKVGDTFTFEGTFSQNGSLIRGARVGLVLEGVGEVSYGYTTTEGYYNIKWKADRSGSLKFHTESSVPAAASRAVSLAVSQGPIPVEWWVAAAALGTIGIFIVVGVIAYQEMS